MIGNKKYTFVFDLDGTVCETKRPDQTYRQVKPIKGMPEILRKLHEDGHYIIIHTARNMLTYAGNVGKITAHQVPIIVDWFRQWKIPFDEIVVGKPLADFYICDKAIEFRTVELLKEDLGI